MNLLRESNMQLREENKHNFEECQKLRDVAQKARADYDNLENLLREGQIETEACKKEIEALKKETEMLRMEKENLERRVCERCRNIDVEDYNRLKIDVWQMEEKLKAKDTEIEEMKTLGSKRQETIMQLEQQLASSRVELNEKEKKLNDILQAEAVRKPELEKQKRIIGQLKRKHDILSKEKEGIFKENQALSKQLDELKQGKKSMGDVTGEQVMKEKEEKDTRIQILERTVERQREELKKEKDDHQKEKERRQKGEKAIWDSAKNAEQWKTKISSELEQHKQAVKRLSDELQKIKNAECNLPEGTSVVQHLSGTNLDDHASSYLLAVENFERVARTVSSELGSGAPPLDTSVVSDASATATTGPAVATQALISSSSAGPAPSNLPPKAADGKDRLVLARTMVETRKQGRKLVRPRLGKPEEAQGDVEMTEAEGSSLGGKVASSQDVETQVNLTQQSQPLVRKRLASSTSELREESLLQGEPTTEIAAPAPKKSKGTDSPPEDAGGQSAAPLENIDSQPVIEESIDAVSDIPQEEADDAGKEEVDTTGEKTEELKESQQVDGASEAEMQNEKNNASEENLDKATGAEMASDEGLKDQTEQENQQLTLESESEREEGELLPDVTDPEGVADISNLVGSPEIGEVLPEAIGTPVVSPTRVEDEAMVAVAAETGDVTSPEAANDEKNEEGDVTEENVEGSDKSNDGNDHVAVEADQVPEAASVISETASTSSAAEPEASKHLSSSTTTAAEVKQASPVNNPPTIVNLRERARERAMQRQAGVVPPSVSRGRGRPAGRGRVARGGRGGRGQTPGQQ
ncbi:hypothetical protein Patl1_19768 [Pistacia atlantica]|uniref:Uncharacterized protein n=1 Tax=Pistacia atlantica TaxID=434234 RepID=A0ACC1BL43_9ROSI|nr:hypothetical protein Patl1_19768 [Pistacia atlantica]